MTHLRPAVLCAALLSVMGGAAQCGGAGRSSESLDAAADHQGASDSTTEQPADAPLTPDAASDAGSEADAAESGAHCTSGTGSRVDASTCAGPLFGPAVSYPAPGAFATFAADFNGDGRLDLAVTDDADADVNVLLGRGDGTFGSPAAYPAVAPTWDIDVSDVDGDGKLDIVALAGDVQGEIAVLFGKGDGTFDPPQGVVTGSVPASLVVQDFNGDDIPDLATANVNNIAVVLGLGRRSFATATFTAVGSLSEPSSLATGDFDQDGRADLAFTDQRSDTVTILLGRGDGTFDPGVQYVIGAYPGADSRGVASDLNDDGILDLAFCTASGVGVLLGRAGGTFGASRQYPAGRGPVSVAAVDVDGDGRLDLVTGDNSGNSVGVLLGRGDGTFSDLTTYPVGPHPGGNLGIADFNGDCVVDVAITDIQSKVDVLLGTGCRPPPQGRDAGADASDAAPTDGGADG